jgi:hypothetical protein
MSESAESENRGPSIGGIIAILVIVLISLFVGFKWMGSTSETLPLVPPPTVTVAPLIAPAETAPADALVVATHRPWVSTRWGEQPDLTDRAILDPTGTNPRFIVDEPNKRRVWVHGVQQPIDLKQFPIIVMRYRAKNLSTISKYYMLWAEDGTGPMQGGKIPFRTRELIDDGKEQVATMDLRPIAGEMLNDSLTTFALGVDCGDNAPATFELIDLRFEPAPKSEHIAPENDAPIAVTMQDETGKPVAGVTVTVDTHYLNWSRSGQTDEQGKVTLTPLKNRFGKHTLAVKKEGFAPMMYSNIDSASGAVTMKIIAEESRGGIVQDEQGDPVAGAIVQLFGIRPQDGSEWLGNGTAVTDAEGKWAVNGVPSAADFRVRVYHPEFPIMLNYQPLGSAQLKNGSLNLTLKREAPAAAN